MGKIKIDQFSDIKILKYHISNFDNLSNTEKKLIYCLSQAALSGRDIFWDQNFKYNLIIRKILEAIYIKNKDLDNSSDFKYFTTYLKRVWFSNGIHHHYSTEKITPLFNRAYFHKLLKTIDYKSLNSTTLSEAEFIELIEVIIFSREKYNKRISQDSSKDLISNSSNNYYQNITDKEVKKYYNVKKEDIKDRISLGLNSKLYKVNDKIIEETYKENGLYSEPIKKIIYWLSQAICYTQNNQQKEWLKTLIEYYQTGDLKTFDNYSILWLKDTESSIDTINGFIEVYGDPLGIKGSWEANVNIKNEISSKRTEILSQNAQWFEDNSPVNSEHKKSKVKGVSAKVIDVIMLGGDCYPSSPLGINLPNSEWIRETYGSKSVTIENIAKAHLTDSLESGFLEEFAYDKSEIELNKKYGFLASNLHTDLHECLGHGSGKIKEGINTDILKNYYSIIEEARADLFALYYIMDQKMIDLGLISTKNVAICEYQNYIRNGLMTQLVRIEPDKNIEQAHMRNRQLICKWCYEKGKKNNVIEKIIKENKTYFVVNDFNRLRELFGDLLNEIQRIKSEGDYNAAKKLVENYGTKVDKNIHNEILNRYKKLGIAPYTGFVNPILTPIYNNNNEWTDVKLDYCNSYEDQMLEYSEKYSFL